MKSDAALLPGFGPKRWSKFKLWGCDDRKALHCPLDGMENVSSHLYANDDLDAKLYEQIFCNACTESTVQSVYFEAGALDGEHASNTRLFEELLNFRGMLVEGHPRNGVPLWANRGKSGRNIIINEAMCRTPGSITYQGHHGQGTAGVVEAMGKKYLSRFSGRMSAIYQTPCRSLGEMLRPVGEPTGHFASIDLFSLDVEGSELTVLETMDWSLPVRLFLIEMASVSKQQDDRVRQLLASKGYAPLAAPDMFFASNEAFVHRDLLVHVDRRRAYCNRCQPLPRRSRGKLTEDQRPPNTTWVHPWTSEKSNGRLCALFGSCENVT